MDGNERVLLSWNVLRYAYAAVLFLAGLDKILGTNLIVEWPKYISPFVSSLLPVSAGVFLVVMGVVEVAVAGLLATKFARLGGYLSVFWLVIISINLLMFGAQYIDIAVRDLLLAAGAYALAELTIATEALGLRATRA